MYLYVKYIYSTSNGRESDCVTMFDVNLIYWSEYLRTGKYHASIRPYSGYVLTPSTFISPVRYSQAILLFHLIQESIKDIGWIKKIGGS